MVGKRKTYTEKTNEVFVQFHKRNMNEIEANIVDSLFAGLPIDTEDIEVFNRVAVEKQRQRDEVAAKVAELDKQREELLSKL